MRRSNLTLALYLCLVFLSGVCAGGFAYRLYMLQSVSAKNPPRTPDEFRLRYLREMRDRLHLREEQVQKLDAIMDATRARFHDFREKHKPELEAIEADRVAQVRAMLNDSQRQQYEKVRQEHEQRRKQGRK